MKLRYKRSASLPSIELNRELAKKIRRMLKDEEQTQEDALQKQLTDLKLSHDADKSTSEIKYEYEFIHGQVLQVRLGDITEETADIIVCSSSSPLFLFSFTLIRSFLILSRFPISPLPSSPLLLPFSL